MPFQEIRARLEGVYAAVQEQSAIAFTFEREDSRAHVNSHIFYLRYIGPLPRGSDVKVDITINELLAFPLAERPILRGYEEFSDLPENRSLLVYSLEEIATEKTVALADPARNEPRDLYDLWHLTTNEGMDMALLVPAQFAGNSNSAAGSAKGCKLRLPERKRGWRRSGRRDCHIK